MLGKIIAAAAALSAAAAVLTPARPVLAVEEASVRSFAAETDLAFPYEAEIIADSVLVRSGPGTNYYSSGKLEKGAVVKVVATQFSWSRIVPPPGSFCWISSRYVSRDPDNPGTGIVTGDGVRVYAGSEHLKPLHSKTMQLKLVKGDKVTFMGDEEDGYIKIVPPAGAYLWVSSEYVRKLEPAPKQAPEIPAAQEFPPPATKPEFAEATEEPSSSDVQSQPKPRPRRVATPQETEPWSDSSSKAMDDYRRLEEQIAAERMKPIAEQDYSRIEEKLSRMAGMKEDEPKVARYAEFTLGQVKRYQLAAEVARQIEQQDSLLEAATHKIKGARAARMAEIPHLGEFAVIGIFRESNIFGPEMELRRYTVSNEQGNIACYAVPVGIASGMDLSRFEERRVGLSGTIEAHPEISGALVRFTRIVALD